VNDPRALAREGGAKERIRAQIPERIDSLHEIGKRPDRDTPRARFVEKAPFGPALDPAPDLRLLPGRAESGGRFEGDPLRTAADHPRDELDDHPTAG
jgi:hypothetical protein